VKSPMAHSQVAITDKVVKKGPAAHAGPFSCFLINAS
jgi:hypothetical protein